MDRIRKTTDDDSVIKERMYQLARKHFNAGWKDSGDWEDIKYFTLTNPKINELKQKKQLLTRESKQNEEEIDQLDDLIEKEYDVLYDLMDDARDKEFKNILQRMTDIYSQTMEEGNEYAEVFADERVEELSYYAGFWGAYAWMQSLKRDYPGWCEWLQSAEKKGE